MHKLFSIRKGVFHSWWAVLLVLAWGGINARAAYVNYVIGNGGLETFNITWDGTTENALAGGIKLTQPSASGLGHQGGLPQTYFSVCTDIGGTLFLGYSYGYSQPQVFNGHNGVDPSWGTDNRYALASAANAASAIQAAADIFYQHSTVLTSGSLTDKAALQLAVWEALYDTTAGSASYNLASGRFSVNAGDLAARTEAQSWLSQVNASARYAGFLLIPDPVQQYGLPGQEVFYNVSPVPEPTTMIAGALLLLPLGASLLRFPRQDRAAG
jgi:hypothetical protein